MDKAKMDSAQKECASKFLQLEQDDARSLDSILHDKIIPQQSLFFRIDRLGQEKGVRPEQCLENIYSIFLNSPTTITYYVTGNGGKIGCWLGVTDGSKTSLGEYLDILKEVFCGNFRGSHLSEALAGSQVLNSLKSPGLRFSSLLGVPSWFLSPDERNLQSLDYVIQAMAHRTFHIVIQWRPINGRRIDEMLTKLRSIYAQIAPLGAIHRSESTSSTTTDSGKKSEQKTSGTDDTTVNKNLLLWQKKLDEELFPRMSRGAAKGMYLCSVYLAAESEANLAALESSFSSVYQSDTPSCAPLFSRRLPDKPLIPDAIINGHLFSLTSNANWLVLRSRLLDNGSSSLATLLTAREVALIAGLPRADVPGLEINPRVSFGLNLPKENGEISLGNLMQDGNMLDNEVCLAAKDLCSHVFVAGTTGAGKTTTCRRIVREARCGFLVIEPAKTEYRELASDPVLTDMFVFTIGNEGNVPFRINPFEFMKGEKISAHIDMLKACFMASFNMEAAMPNLMEEAMYRLYEKFGWDISTNENRFLHGNAERVWDANARGRWFPTIDDYIEVLVDVVKGKNFGERLEGEYIGSLRGRLDSLTVGVKGKILNTKRSIDFQWLLDQKAVLELEDLKSGEDKAFMMALIIGRLLEAIKLRYRANQNEAKTFRHILLLEEAHRLLTRLDFVDNPCKQMGVDIFTDMLAEVRKYNESLIIVDQIPAKLAPEVLKNTNTKIVHRLFAEDDKRIIGETMALDNLQKDFLSRLDRGEAIIYGNGWNKPAHVKIKGLAPGNTDGERRALKNGRDFWKEHKTILCPAFPDDGQRNPSLEKLQHMCDVAQKIRNCLKDMRQVDFQAWKDLLTYVRQVTGDEYGDLFLRAVISDALFTGELLKNRKLDFNVAEHRGAIQGSKKSKSEKSSYVDQLLSDNKSEFRHIKTLLTGG